MIVDLKYTRRYNTSDYTHQEYTVGYSVSDDECPASAMQNMKQFVQDAFENKLAVPLKEVKDVGKTVTKKNGEERDAEMVAVEVEEEVKEVETMKQFNKEVNPKPPKKKRRAPKKATPYNRELPEHRKEMAAILNKEVPEWKASKESTIQAKGLSEVLAGKDFLDGKTGEVLPSFIEEVVKGMEISDEL